MTLARRSRALFLAAAGVLGGAGPTSGMVWNGGSGAWSTSAPNWDGTSTWVQGNDAVIGTWAGPGGPGGVLTLAEPINANHLTFNADNYTIDLNGFTFSTTGNISHFSDPGPPPADVAHSTTVVHNSSATLATYNAARLSNAGPRLSGNMNVNLTGTAGWTPTAINTFTGTLTLAGSDTVTAQRNENLGSASGLIILAGKSLVLSAIGTAETYTRAIAVGAGGTVGTSNRFVTVTGTISGQQLNRSGGQGALVLAGDNAFDGKLVINSSGSVTIAASPTAFGAAHPTNVSQNVVEVSNRASTIGFAGNVDVLGTKSISTAAAVRNDGLGHIHNFDGNNSFAGDILLDSATMTFVSERDSSLLLKGLVSGNRSLIKLGEGTLTLANTMTYGRSSSEFSRLTRVADGTLQFDFSQPTSPLVDIVNNVARSTSDNVLSLAGGTFEVKGKSNVDNSQHFGNVMRVDVGASSMVIDNAANNNVNVRISGTSITRAVGGTVDFTLADGAQVANLNGYTTSKTNVSGIFGGYATVNRAQWAQSGNAAGTYAITGYTHSAAEQGAAAFNTATNNVDVNGANSTPASGRTVNSLRFAGSTPLTLAGTNTLTSGGILVTGAGSSEITGGTIRGANTGDLIVHQFSSGNFTIGSNIVNNVGATSLTKVGGGTLTLSGNNTYTGKTLVHGGLLKLDSANALPGGTNATGGDSQLSFHGGVVGLTSDFRRSVGTGVHQVEWLRSGGFAAYGDTRVVNLGGSGAIVRWNNNSTSTTWNPGGSSTTVAGAGLYNGGFFVGTNYKLIFGAEDASGTIDFQNPIDLAGGANIPTARTIDVIDSSTVDVEGTMSGVLSGDLAGLNKTGDGTLALSANNTYTGDTLVSAGTLLVNGSLASGASVTVRSGGTLGGMGTIGGTITIEAGGTIAPGASVESLHVGSLTLENDSISLFEIEGDGSSGAFDQLIASGPVVFDGILQVDFAADYGEGEWNLFDFTSSIGNFDAIIDLSGTFGSSQLSFNSSTGILTVIPEPANLSLLSVATFLLFRRRRERIF